MLTRLMLTASLALVACALPTLASESEPRELAIFGAHVSQGEYGASIENPDCPAGGLPIEVDQSLQGSEFVKVLRHGAGQLGLSSKFVVIDGVVRTTGELGFGSQVTLVRVYAMKEVLNPPAAWVAKMRSTEGCEKDNTRRRAWLKSIQVKGQ